MRWLVLCAGTAFACIVDDAAVAAASSTPARPAADNSADAADSIALGRSAAAGGPWKFSALATVDLLANTRGGAARGFRVLDKLALAAAYDADGRWVALLSAQYTNGTPFSGSLVADTQTVSNIEAIGSIRVYEAWLMRRIGTGGIKVGLVDLNSEFDVQDAGGLFLNSSDGIAAEFSHTGRNGPSIFPTTALAITGFAAPARGWTLRLGVFDGVPGDPAHPRRFAVKLGGDDGALVVGQVTRDLGDGLRVEAGAWRYTAAFDALDRVDATGKPQRLRASQGAYAIIEGDLIAPADGKPSLRGWLRGGVADARVNRIAGYLGGGLVISPGFGGHAGDSAGVSVMHASFGGAARRAEPGLHGGETTIEATYRAVLPWGLAVQPDLQYVIHPGGNPGVRDALVAGVRLTLAVSH